jgi:homocysteine S-methyltransferase
MNVLFYFTVMFAFLDVRNILIAGSVGPYGAHLHDGSEYTGNYVEHMRSQEIADWHRPRLQALVEADVDLLALETIPAQKEAETLVELLREFPKQKAWLSFSCKVSVACRMVL